MELLEVENLTFTYPKQAKDTSRMAPALEDVSFEIQEGEFIVVCGESGCGKTTTLTIIAGFQKATDGVIKVNGAKVEKPGPDRAFYVPELCLVSMA